VIPLGPVRGRALGVEDDGVAVLVFVEGEVCCSRSKDNWIRRKLRMAWTCGRVRPCHSDGLKTNVEVVASWGEFGCLRLRTKSFLVWPVTACWEIGMLFVS
jgi:hypothetical protein